MITTESCRLLTLTSLLVKIHGEEEAVGENMRRIVTLLERAIVFPELAELADQLQDLLDEAKCQVRVVFLERTMFISEKLVIISALAHRGVCT